MAQSNHDRFLDGLRQLSPELSEWEEKSRPCPGGAACTCASVAEHYQKLADEARRLSR